MPLSFSGRPDRVHVLRCAPARRAVVSWNSGADEGEIELQVGFSDGTRSRPLPYARWSRSSRSSLGGRDERVHLETDVVVAGAPFESVEVRASATLEGVALATPPERAAGGETERASLELDVPMLSQYVSAEGRGWCSPASVAMLLRAGGVDAEVETVARAAFDDAYGGAGNWTFNVAHASRFGRRAFVAYLRDLAHARTFLENAVPLALSLAWKAGELAGAPLPASDGHVVVLRGFERDGDPIVNDPAHPSIRTTYRRAEFERAWLGHGGVAYVIAQPSIPTVELANR